jgi:hypothetical protein
MNLRQQRYDELSAMDTDDQTDEQIEEQTRLYYELYHPELADEQISCRCGQMVRADRLQDHECPPDPAGEMRRLESSETWQAYLRGELDPRTREF